MSTQMPECLHIGSVKNIHGKEGESPYYFEFSDRYSVFDWGSMPDSLDSKGEVLATMAGFFFDYLGNKENWKNWEPSEASLKTSATLAQFREFGVRHHGLGVVDENLNDTKQSNIYKVRPVKVLRPKGSQTASGFIYDYSVYQTQLTDALVPLEVVFRFGVPEGSSLLKRVQDDVYLKQLGLDKIPVVGDEFTSPVVEFSTKLENVDRYMNYAQAKEIAGLSDSELSNLIETVKLLALHLKDIFAGAGTKLWDGKFEFAFAPELQENGERIFMLVDSIGPDELRLTYEGTQLSKECLRKYYRSSSWFSNVEKAKQMAEAEAVEDWKKICVERLNSTPPHLDSKIKETIEMMYKSLMQSLANKYISKDYYPNAWPLSQVATSLKEILND